MIRWWALAAALALAAPSLAEDTPSAIDGGDPTLIHADGKWWLYRTGGPKGALEALASTDLVHWQPAGTLIAKEAVAWIDDDGAAQHSLWAPDMVRAGGKWFFYYSVGPQNPTPSRIGVAVCKGPAGPCTDIGKPLVNDGGNGFEAIDPMVFRDAKSGKAYLYAGGSAGATLRVFELARDMVSIAREVPVAQPPHFTEGAFMHERRGTYYLSYSHGKWNDATYQVHYATAPGPTGPWTYRGVILQSDTKYKGPGHHSFVHAPDGRWLIAYHRWEGQTGDGPYKGKRRIAIQPIRYLSDGAIAPVVISR